MTEDARSRSTDNRRWRRRSAPRAGVASRAELLINGIEHCKSSSAFGQKRWRNTGSPEKNPTMLPARMTAILGISAFYHDSAVALVVDGEVVAAAQEERFSRRKHDSSFPSQALAYCLREGGVSP